MISTGIYSSSSSQATLQATVNGFASFWETRALSADYSNTSFPTNSTDTYTISYYDNYSFPGNTFGGPTGAGQVDAPKTKGLLTGSKVKILGTSTMLLTVNYYDKEARMVQLKAQNHLSGTDVITQTYSFVGELLSSTRTHVASSVTTTIATYTDYDHMGRKIATRSAINGQPEVMLSRSEYNELGQLSTQKLHSSNNGTSFLYSSGYNYNERGWLKQMTGTVFNFELYYNDAINGMPLQFSGNIANQAYNNNGSNTFNYTYDKLNRLTNGSATGMTEALTYDVMGNIQKLNRNSAGLATYSYTGNKLNSISGGGLTTAAYGYDGNGNATTDGRTGVTLTYNYLNLPQTAIKSGLNLAYTYDATGNKLKKLNSTTSTTTDYVGGIQYTNGVIDFIQTEGGIAKDTLGVYRYSYNLTDHLGNVRATIRESVATPGSLQVMQRDNYYPFGLTQVAGARNNKYLYNNKELQAELGQYDYGARFYDPVIGRWNVPDILADLAPDLTPFRYAFNNPINYIDPFGLWEKSANGYSTDKREDIERFLNYLDIERNSIKNDPTFEQMSNFIGGEMKEGGLGMLSDGSKLAKGFTIMGQKDIYGGNHWVTDQKSYNNFWHSIQGDLTPNALDPRTLNQQWGGLLGEMSYPGGDNPKKYNGLDDYSVIPSKIVEYPAIIHDLKYTRAGVSGFKGLATSSKVIGADYKFVGQELALALNPGLSLKQRSQALILGTGLGLVALPKTLNALLPLKAITLVPR